jgi:1-deoxy-D-xylulose-5-phosphate reductoisomerase
MQNIFDLNKSIIFDRETGLRQVIILGASGSVGKQTFELCIAHSDKFKIKTLISGQNVEETIRQALIAKPEYIVMANEAAAAKVRESVNCKVLSGDAAKKEIISIGYDIAITAIPGINGLISTFDAIKHAKIVAFANKETIIYAGEKLIEEAQRYNTCIIPIDSEHNAIFQILDGIDQSKVDKIILTASGGPLLNRVDFDQITVEDVLKHPTWNMGQKISVDSATLMNKALEVIEASYLFGRDLDDIDIIIHPESIIHGMVRIKDGSCIMHASAADMKLPIAYALSWPAIGFFSRDLDLSKISKLTFLEPDYNRFPLFKLAINAAKDSVKSRVVMNYANELAVNLFLQRRILFRDIYQIVDFALNIDTPHRDDVSFADLDNIFNQVKSHILNKFL